MENLNFLADYMTPVIIGICLCIGYIVKHWLKDVDNKIIPTLCAVLGVALAAWIHWPAITPEVILTGLASGLAATGLHQAVYQYFNKGAVIMGGIDVDEMTDDQIRAVLPQLGYFADTSNFTREELLAALDEAASCTE